MFNEEIIFSKRRYPFTKQLRLGDASICSERKCFVDWQESTATASNLARFPNALK